jgi:hypothetical protein
MTRLDLYLATPGPASVIVADHELQVAVDELYDAMETLPAITDQESFDAVRALVQRASNLRSDLEACRKRAKAPFAAIVDSIDGVAREIRERIEVIITEGKHQETAFLVERNRRIAEETRRQQQIEEAARLAAAAEPTRPTPSLVPAVQAAAVANIEAIKAPLATRRSVRITQQSLVPGKYWMLNMAAIEADWKLGVQVPGTEYVEEQYVVAR